MVTDIKIIPRSILKPCQGNVHDCVQPNVQLCGFHLGLEVEKRSAVSMSSMVMAGVMSRGCTCTSNCLTPQKQEIGSWPMDRQVRQG